MVETTVVPLQPIFYPKVMHTKIYVPPRFLNSGFEKKIVELLVSRYENKCCQEGFVQKDSIQLLDRENGSLYGNQFNGDICFFVKFSCMICNPVDGMIIEGTIKDMNRLGILAEHGPLSIVVARQFHTNRAFFDTMHIGDTIHVEVVRSRFFLNDRKIEIIGKYVESGELRKKLESKRPTVAWNLEKRKEHEEPYNDISNLTEEQNEISEFSDMDPEEDLEDEEDALEEESEAQEDMEGDMEASDDDVASVQEGGVNGKDDSIRGEDGMGISNDLDEEESESSSYSGDEEDEEDEGSDAEDAYSDVDYD
jgi:DNA-directed RNA polymerase subunit E'/Rpb7